MGQGQDEDTRDSDQTGSHHCISKRFSSMIDAHGGEDDLSLLEENIYAPPGAFRMGVEARPMVDTNRQRIRGAGGTPGGIGTFFLGFIMIVAGGYLLTDQVMVTSGAWRWGGYNAFGLSLLPLLLGVGLLFVNGRSLAGWLLTWAGAVIIFVGILAYLEIYFRPTSLFNTLLMLVLLVGGLGLVARSLRAS
jgi:hypothetical protein